MSLPLTAVSIVALGAIRIRAVGVRVARAGADLFVASRAISLGWNAAAISSGCETIAPPGGCFVKPLQRSSASGSA